LVTASPYLRQILGRDLARDLRITMDSGGRLIPRENDDADAVPVTILESVLFCPAAV
jgi:hypothetical protein